MIGPDEMTEHKKSRAKYVALTCGLALITGALVSALLFCLKDSWTQDRIFAVIVLWLLSLPFFEFGSRGKWFFQYSVPSKMWERLLRLIAGITGLVFLYSAIELSFFPGPGAWKRSTVGFVLGLYNVSFLLIRWALTGKWSLGADNVS